MCSKEYARWYTKYQLPAENKTEMRHSDIPNNTICKKVLAQGDEAFYKCQHGQWTHLGTIRRTRQHLGIRRKLLHLSDNKKESDISNEFQSGHCSVIKSLSNETDQMPAVWRESKLSRENCSVLCEIAQCQQELSLLASCCNLTFKVLQQLIVKCTCNDISKYAVYCMTGGICGLVITLTSIAAACIKKFKLWKPNAQLVVARVQGLSPEPIYSSHLPNVIHVTPQEKDNDESLEQYDNNFDREIDYVSSSESEETINHYDDTQGIALADRQNNSSSDSAIHFNESNISSVQVKDLTDNEYDFSDFDDSIFNDYNNIFVTTADVHNVDDTIRFSGTSSRNWGKSERTTSGGVEDDIYEMVFDESIKSTVDVQDDRIDDCCVYQNMGLEGSGMAVYGAPSEAVTERHHSSGREINQPGTIFESALSRLIETVTLPLTDRRPGVKRATSLAAVSQGVSNTLPRPNRVSPISNDYLIPVVPDYKVFNK